MKGKFLKDLFLAFMLVTVGLFLTGCSESAMRREAEVVINFAHVVNPRTPKGMAAEEFKRVLEERSDGRFYVSVYSDSVLGNDQEITELMMLNALHMNAPMSSTLTSFISEFEIFDLPYLFPSEEVAFEALHGALGEKFDELLREQNLVSLGYWSGGFRQLTNSVRPIEHPYDMDGLRMRVTQSPLLVTTFRALNAGGISVPFSELYMALQMGTVDGQENPLANIATQRFYEVQTYMTMSDHNFVVFPVIISLEKYESLDEDMRLILREVATEINEFAWNLNRAYDDEYLQIIIDAGVNISYFNDEAKADFRRITDAAWVQFSQLPLGQSLIDIAESYANR